MSVLSAAPLYDLLTYIFGVRGKFLPVLRDMSAVSDYSEILVKHQFLTYPTYVWRPSCG